MTSYVAEPHSQVEVRIWDFLLIGLGSLLLASMVGLHVESRAAEADALQNLNLGLNLSHHGVYGRAPDAVGYHIREPFFPWVLALTDQLYGLLGLPQVDYACSLEPANLEARCRTAYRAYKLPLVLFLAGMPLLGFLLVMQFTGRRSLAYPVAVLIGLDRTLILGTQDFLTELPAAFLMLLSTWLMVRVCLSWKVRTAILLGLSLAALVLTKVVFVYALPFVLGGLVLQGWLAPPRKPHLHAMLKAGTAVLVAYGCLVGGYMVRNFVTADNFALVEHRSYQVHTIRAWYNSMTHAEFLAGFDYYYPGPNRGQNWQRFATDNPDGFRMAAQTHYRNRVQQLLAEGKDWEEVSGIVSVEATEMMLADPLQHLQVTPLLAWRGVFLTFGLGYERPPLQTTIASDQGWQVPRPNLVWPTMLRGAFDVLLMVAMVALAVVALWRKRAIWFLPVLLALYSHSVYALVSHFIPRYAWPEMPLRLVALAICLHLLFTWVNGLRRDARAGMAAG